MSMAADFGCDEWEAPERDEFWHEEEDVLIEPPTEAELQEWPEPEADPFGD